MSKIPKTIKDLQELDRKPKQEAYQPVPTLNEDAASIDGLIDLLIVKGVIQGDNETTAEQLVKKFIDRYGSAINGLYMLLIEKELVTEEELHEAQNVYHDAVRHFGARATTFEEVQSFRKNMLRKRLGLDAQKQVLPAM